MEYLLKKLVSPGFISSYCRAQLMRTRECLFVIASADRQKPESVHLFEITLLCGGASLFLCNEVKFPFVSTFWERSKQKDNLVFFLKKKKSHHCSFAKLIVK